MSRWMFIPALACCAVATSLLATTLWPDSGPPGAEEREPAPAGDAAPAVRQFSCPSQHVAWARNLHYPELRSCDQANADATSDQSRRSSYHYKKACSDAFGERLRSEVPLTALSYCRSPPVPGFSQGTVVDVEVCCDVAE